MNVDFLEPASEEFQAAVDFYEDQAAGLGDELIDEIEQVVERLRTSPRIGAPLTEATRRIPVRRFPFYVIYAVESQAVVIVAVAHQRREPGYWKDRGD